jgi:hypothetical protein
VLSSGWKNSKKRKETCTKRSILKIRRHTNSQEAMKVKMKNKKDFDKTIKRERKP